jgi:hypothetical protein
MTRTLRACVENTNFSLPHHVDFWKKVESYLPAGCLEDSGVLGKIWTTPQSRPVPTQEQRREWVSKIKALNLSQPTPSTCQSACIGMAVGDANVMDIRDKLLARGMPGDPAVMASVIREYGYPYKLELDASIRQVIEWLKAGEFLITHGWFTGPGHVICLDGLKKSGSNEYAINVKDPWSEFDASKWIYKNVNNFYDGFYSERLIYATCVAGTSRLSARDCYRRKEFDPAKGGMWVHRFLTQ